MRYRVLGRLDVCNGTRWITLNAAKQRALLAHLLINAGRFVPADALIAELWGDDVPDSAAKSLQVYVHRLRRALGGDPEALHTRPGGYELAVEPDGTDAARFATLAAAGRAELADRRPAAAVETLTEALGLWRGPAFADVPATDAVRAEAARLEENRLTAWEDLADAKLAVGRHPELAAELGALLAQHPLREPLWGRLMLALHRAGRRSDALRTYARARRMLADELGVEPGAQLQEVHAAVLAGGREPAPRPAAAERPAYCQLPARIPDFVGRREQLVQVLRWLGRPEGAADREVPGFDASQVDARHPAPRTVLVTGVAGAGKSTFAVHAAHLLRDAFPDGQLHADLRTAAGHPADTGDVLASLLKTLGMTGAGIPESLEERARRYRAELADRRVLVVLDNAGCERQIRPLLPGTGDSAVLVTSRAALAGLEGALRVGLGLLSDAEALELLARAAGDDRTRRDPAVAARIAAQCGNLPLALRIAGARLATRRHLSLPRLADALADERRRLDELVAGDLEVRASVTLGYAALDPAAQRAFRLLGLLDVPTVPGWVVAALLGDAPGGAGGGGKAGDGVRGDGAAGGDTAQGERHPADPAALAERSLDALVDNHLVEVHAAEPAAEPRYRLHDLLRLYARERAHAQEPPAERAAALGRVHTAYLDLARRADDALSSGFSGRVKVPAPGHSPPAAEAARVAAEPLAWLEAERTTLRALVRQAADAGEAGTAWRLAAALAAFFESSAHFDDWRETHRTALAAATAAGDRLGVAVLHRNLGELETVQDHYGEAVVAFKRSLKEFAALDRPLALPRAKPGDRPRDPARAPARDGRPDTGGHHPAESAAAAGLGVLLRLRGQYAQAAACLRRGIERARAGGNVRSEAYARCGLGTVHLECGEPVAARREFDLALALAQQDGYRHGEASAERNLGLADLAVGRVHAAAARMLRSCELAVESGDRVGEVHALQWLGHLTDVAGEPARGERMLDESLAAYRRFGERFGEALTLRAQADLLLHAHRPAEAKATARQALSIWRHLDTPYWTSRTLDVLAAAHAAAGGAGGEVAAARVRRQASALRASVGLPTALRAPVAAGRRLGGHLTPPPDLPQSFRTPRDPLRVAAESR
ncbi:winged helix-turn-helix domain-containing protein [Streptomyces sp. NBC_01808]|uniref:AfsR/SARP family transcriptional regulator n=1 Tax=Streptomyces sp. NBC_01808 TaxID=2975947 RepID=UPI002DDA4DFA|nr:BTAD domain-containing putative transcriptional regulator [Streptomyces sp. NBC_01808]WSA36959.1 winged helix-turn-helix domain-containing protein [Streptomyces sp. NBC_01808]